MFLLCQTAGFIACAQEGNETNTLAYLGTQIGERSITPTPAPTSVTGTTNTEWFGGTPWLQWSRLTGDWGGGRPMLETNGLTLPGRFTTDSSAGWGDGIRERGIQRGLLDLNLTFDPEPLLGISGGTFFAQYFYRYGPHGSDDIGDIQGYDNIDARHLSQVEELWYEQKLIHNRLRLKVGQVDANAEFENSPASAGFINSSAAFSPTLLDFPTYPKPAVSANMFVYPTEWFYCGAGVYTENLRELSVTRFQHPYLIGESGVTYPAFGPFGPGRIAAGFWHGTATLCRFDGRLQTGTSGFCAIASQQIWKSQTAAADDTRSVTVFVQYSHADPDVSPVSDHVGIGVSAAGLLPARPGDGMGIYWSWARLSRDGDADFDENESSLEEYYQCQVTPFFAVKPDFQWIQHPGGQFSPGSAVVFTIRLIIDF